MTGIYETTLKPVLFKFDPEKVHTRMIALGVLFGNSSVARSIVRRLFCFNHPALESRVAGIEFQSPVGLAAGFDKNAQLHAILPELGFGFAELGSITGEPCSGNPRPRLFRVPREKSIIVNYGLCNDGCEEIAKRLAGVQFRIPVGFSVAKTNIPLSLEQGISDYQKAFRTMHPFGAYTTINVSCPNTDGLTFGHPENLAPLLDVLAGEKHVKPVFLKIKPDMTNSQLAEIIQIVDKHDWVTGFIISNLTMHREGLGTSREELDKISVKGGLSGLPVQQKSNNAIKFVHKNSGKLIIGCGGVFTGKDAFDKLKNGAVLVQLVTGLIYRGPGVVASINRELVDIIQQNGFKNLPEFIAAVHGT